MKTLKERPSIAEHALARQIIQLDLKRDELFEELICLVGNKAHDLLRKLQNGY